MQSQYLFIEIEAHLVYKHVLYLSTPKNPIFGLVTYVNTRDFTVQFTFLFDFSCEESLLNLCKDKTVVELISKHVQMALFLWLLTFLHELI